MAPKWQASSDYGPDFRKVLHRPDLANLRGHNNHNSDFETSKQRQRREATFRGHQAGLFQIYCSISVHEAGFAGKAATVVSTTDGQELQPEEGLCRRRADIPSGAY